MLMYSFQIVTYTYIADNISYLNVLTITQMSSQTSYAIFSPQANKYFLRKKTDFSSNYSHFMNAYTSFHYVFMFILVSTIIIYTQNRIW